jgi:thiamine phosphate synthase YjbQ (UPF0047 family)
MVQSRRTTAGLLINENEPLLLEDLTELFERLVPKDVVPTARLSSARGNRGGTHRNFC